MHLSKQGFRRYILLIWPSYSSKQDSYLIEVVNILQLAKNTVIEIGFKVKDTFTPILNFYIDTEARHWLNYFHIPIHGDLSAEKSCRDFHQRCCCFSTVIVFCQK